MFKVNNKDTRTTPCFTPCSSVSIVNFEHVITGWVSIFETSILSEKNLYFLFTIYLVKTSLRA